MEGEVGDELVSEELKAEELSDEQEILVGDSHQPGHGVENVWDEKKRVKVRRRKTGRGQQKKKKANDSHWKMSSRVSVSILKTFPTQVRTPSTAYRRARTTWKGEGESQR